MSTMSIYDIKDDEISIEGKAWDDSEVQRLCMKHIYLKEKCLEYWQPLLERGDKLFGRYDGNILDDYQRSVYKNVEDKIIVEPPIGKSPIRALVGQTMKSRRSGQIITEAGSLDESNMSVDEITTVSITMKDLETKTKEKYLLRDAIEEAFVTGYPIVLYFDKNIPSDYNPLKAKEVKLPWNSCIFGPPNFNQIDNSDIREFFWYRPRSQADLEENFPEQVENIRNHWGSKGNIDASQISSIMQWEGDDSASQRNYLFSILDRAKSSSRGPDGMLPVVQHLYPIRRKEEVWVNLYDDDDVQVIPSTWKPARKKQWIEENANKYHGPLERTITTLWCTVFTTSGLVLSHGKHWYQEDGRLPAVVLIPCMINGVPSGPMVDMSSDILANCVAQIEWLDDIRKGSGSLVLFKEGAIKNLEQIPEEANKGMGVGIVDRKFQGPVTDAFAEIKRQPTDIWRQYGEARKQDMLDNTSLNETMQGQAAPRQAAVAKELEIAQALLVNAIYIDNINLAWECLQNLKLSLIPYVYDEYSVVECFDEENRVTQKQEINVPVVEDQTGDKVKIVNDITARRYRWKLNPVDDSTTAKARMMEDALMVINGAAGPLLQKDPSGRMFAKFLMAFPNEFLNKAGKSLAEDAKISSAAQSQAEQQQALMDANIEMTKARAEMLKAEKSGLSIAITGEQLAQYPNLYNQYLQLQQMFGALGGGQPQPQPAMDQNTQGPMQPQSTAMVPMA